MKYSPQPLLTLALLASLTLVSTQSLASTASVSFLSTNTGTPLNLTLPAAGTTTYFSGSLNIDVGGTSFLAYCVDPSQFATGTSLAYGVSSTLSPPFTGSQSGWVSNLYSQSYASTNGSGTNSAAFQLALWELANDDGVLNTGSVRATSPSGTTEALAASMINNAKTGAAGSNHYSFTLYTNAQYQDYLVASVTPVPEPESYAMLLAGLGLMGAVVRRRKTASAAL